MSKNEIESKIQAMDFNFAEFTIERFGQRVGELIGRKIVFLPWDMPQWMYGAWISIENSKRDYIFYGKDFSPILQNHTILHELGHIINDHHTMRITIEEMEEIVRNDQIDQFFQGCALRSVTIEERCELEDVAERTAEVIQRLAIENERMKQLAQVSVSPEARDLLKGLDLS